MTPTDNACIVLSITWLILIVVVAIVSIKRKNKK